MLKRTFRILGLILVFAMVFSMGAFAVENTSTEEISNTAAIESLIDQRAAVLARLNLAEDEKEVIALNASLMEIDRSLTNLGVSFLTNEEILEIKSRDPLPDHELMMQPIGDIAEPLIELPESDVNTWMRYYAFYEKDNVNYMLEVVIVQPRSHNSPLIKYGTNVVTFNQNWQAGAVNALASLGKSTLTELVSDIPGSNIAVSFFDAVSELISGSITAYSIVDVPHIAYTWSNTATVAFQYVKRLGESSQRLSLISTKTVTDVQASIPAFTCISTNTLIPQVTTEHYTITSTPQNYNSYDLAIRSFTTVTGGPLNNFVLYVQISAPENKLAVRIYPIQPHHPAICEP